MPNRYNVLLESASCEVAAAEVRERTTYGSSNIPVFIVCMVLTQRDADRDREGCCIVILATCIYNTVHNMQSI